MRVGPHLVLQGTILGSFILSLMSFLIMPDEVMRPNVSLPIIQQARATATPLTALQENQAGKFVSKSLRNADRCQVSDRFPDRVRQWCKLVSTHASENALSPDLVAALILLESGGNPEAYSKSGAVGLMQVMPRDGLAASFECVNGPCFANRPTIDELRDPAFNVAFGTRMLAGLIARHGDVREALKSYGPMDVGYTYADKVTALWERYGR